MLPPGFHFERYIDGPGLYLGGHVIATAGPANYEPNAPWRVCMSPSGRPRYHFTATEAGAQRYMEAWAAKWESEIREAVGSGGNGLGHLQHNSDLKLQTSHTRRRSRRIPRIAR